MTSIKNTIYNVRHWKEHIKQGYDDHIVKMFKGEEKWIWKIFTWCPVCAITAIWGYMRDESR